MPKQPHPLMLTPVNFFLKLLLFPILITHLHAETPDTNLQKLITTALTHNPELRYYEAKLAQAKGLQTQSRKWKNPELEIESAYITTRDLETSSSSPSPQGYALGISISQTFEFPGKASLRQAITQNNTYIAELALRQFRLTLTSKIRQLYLRYHTASHLEKISSQISRNAHSLTTLVSQRPSTGAIPLLELRLIQSRQHELDQTASEASIIASETHAELNHLLARPPETPIPLPSTLPQVQESQITRQDKESIFHTARTENLLLKIHQAEIEKARKNLHASRKTPLPDLIISPFFSIERTNEEELTAGASLSFDLPLWNQNQGNIVAFEALTLAMQNQLSQAQNQLHSQISTHIHLIHTLNSQLKNLTPNALNDLKAASELAERQYRQGAISVELYLDTQQAYLSSLQIYHHAITRHANALLDLHLLTASHLEASIHNQNNLPDKSTTAKK